MDEREIKLRASLGAVLDVVAHVVAPTGVKGCYCMPLHQQLEHLPGGDGAVIVNARKLLAEPLPNTLEN